MGVEDQPDATLALISVPGRYAGGEAMKALQNGQNVMLFSDNVPEDEEREGLDISSHGETAYHM